jgi:hypothetical protein
MIQIILLFALCFSAFTGLAASPGFACPVRILFSPSLPAAYSDSGDRHEGLFRKQVAALNQLTPHGARVHVSAFAPSEPKRSGLPHRLPRRAADRR